MIALFSHHNVLESRRRAARGNILLVFLRLFVLAYFLRFRFSQLVVRAFTIPFREVQRFMQRATTGATATEIRVKNAIKITEGRGCGNLKTLFF